MDIWSFARNVSIYATLKCPMEVEVHKAYVIRLCCGVVGEELFQNVREVCEELKSCVVSTITWLAIKLASSLSLFKLRNSHESKSKRHPITTRLEETHVTTSSKIDGC